MIAKALYLFLLWRKNDWKGILFKSLFFAVIAWFFVGMFTDFRTAVIGGAAAAIVAAMRYGWRGYKQRQQLLKKVGGDKEKLKELKKMTNAKGLGGVLMNEMLMSDIDDDDYDYDDEREKLCFGTRSDPKERSMVRMTSSWMITVRAIR